MTNVIKSLVIIPMILLFTACGGGGGGGGVVGSNDGARTTVDIKEYIIPSSDNPTSYPLRISSDGDNMGNGPQIFNGTLVINSDYTNYVAYDAAGLVYTWDFESGTGTFGPYTAYSDSQTSSFTVGDIIATYRSEDKTIDVRLYDVIDDTIIIEIYYEDTDVTSLARVTYKKDIGYIYEITHLTVKDDSNQNITIELFNTAYVN